MPGPLPRCNLPIHNDLWRRMSIRLRWTAVLGPKAHAGGAVLLPLDSRTRPGQPELLRHAPDKPPAPHEVPPHQRHRLPRGVLRHEAHVSSVARLGVGAEGEVERMQVEPLAVSALNAAAWMLEWQANATRTRAERALAGWRQCSDSAEMFEVVSLYGIR